MAPHKPASPDKQITIGGKNLTLRYSVRATLALRDYWQLESDRQVEERLSNLGKNPSLDDFITVLWAGMRAHHPEITREDVLDMVDAAGPESLATDVMTSISAATPPADDNSRPPAKAAARNAR